jgi:Tfp pilus assembly protein PilO
MRITALVWLLLLFFSIAAPLRAQVELEEIKRLAGELEDLRAAYEAQHRKIVRLENDVDSLRSALRESNERATSRLSDFVTREDLKKMAEAIEEVDRKRESDRNVILEEMKNALKQVAAAGSSSSSNSRRPAPRNPEPDQPAAQQEGTFYPHKVASGETLSVILDAYNTKFKSEGRKTVTLSQVKKANPKININSIYVGQEILIPVPDKR